MRWLFLLLITWLFQPFPLWAKGIQVVLSESDGAYEEVSRAFLAGLGAGREVTVRKLSDLQPEQAKTLSSGEDLIVPVGTRAARFFAENHVGHADVLALLVPKSTIDRSGLPDSHGKGHFSFVYIDQPLERSLSLVRVLLPRAQRIGVVLSRFSGISPDVLIQEAEQRGFSVSLSRVAEAEEVGHAVRRVLGSSDALLLVPDTVVVSNASLHSILLASYRQRVPVVGFSPGLVKSGAIAAVFSSPEQIGKEGSVMAKRWLATGVLPESRAASQFSVDLNVHVARSLGLALPSERDVEKEIEAHR